MIVLWSLFEVLFICVAPSERITFLSQFLPHPPCLFPDCTGVTCFQFPSSPCTLIFLLLSSQSLCASCPVWFHPSLSPVSFRFFVVVAAMPSTFIFFNESGFIQAPQDLSAFFGPATQNPTLWVLSVFIYRVSSIKINQHLLNNGTTLRVYNVNPRHSLDFSWNEMWKISLS